MIGHALAADRRGATALEFAIVGSVFMLLSLGVIQAGLLLWTKDTLQSVAVLTARCAAIASPACPDPQQFAVTMADNLIFTGVIAKADVTPAPAIVCTQHNQFYKVSISSAAWNAVMKLAPLNKITLSVVAYHPTGKPC